MYKALIFGFFIYQTKKFNFQGILTINIIIVRILLFQKVEKFGCCFNFCYI